MAVRTSNILAARGMYLFGKCSGVQMLIAISRRRCHQNSTLASISI